MTEVVEMFVGMHCEACASSVKRAIRKIPGVESHKIDFYAHKVTVMGKVDREDVRRRIQKTGKQVTLIPKPAPPPPKAEEKKEEKTEKKKDEKKEEKKAEVKATEEKKEEKKEDKKVVESKAETIQVRKKSMYWPAVQLWRFFIPREVKVHAKKQEVVTKVEAKEDKKEEAKGEEKTEEEPGKKETVEKVTKEPEWVPMFVSAPFYTLPSQIQYF